MNILVTCALKTEFNEARNQLSLKETTTKKDLPRIASSKNITLLCTGIGKINSSLNLYPYLYKYKPDLVIDSGTCGAIATNIKIFDIITSTQAMDFFNIDTPSTQINGDVDKVKLLLPDMEISNCIVGSVERSIVSQSQVKLFRDKNISIITWETSTIFSLCSKLQLPFISIRGVTDNCSEDTFHDFKKNRVETCKKVYISVKKLCNSI